MYYFLQKFAEAAKYLEKDERDAFVWALIQYSLYGIEPEMDGAMAMAFSLIRSRIDADRDKYDETVERRRKAGRAGGLAKASKSGNAKSATNDDVAKASKSSNAKSATNDSSKSSVYVFDSDTDPDIDPDTGVKESTLKGAKEKRFTPPTIEEVKAYCRERKNDVDPEKFVDFYESKGWMIGKNKMKSWKAALRTWEKPRDGPAPKSEPNSFHNFDEHGYNYDNLEKKLQERRFQNGQENNSSR